MLFVLAATAVVAVRLFAPASMPKLPVGDQPADPGAVRPGLPVHLSIAWFHNSSSASFSGVKISVHLGIFGYLLVLVSLAQAVAAFLLFKSSGEVMPDFKAMQANQHRRCGAAAARVRHPAAARGDLPAGDALGRLHAGRHAAPDRFALTLGTRACPGGLTPTTKATPSTRTVWPSSCAWEDAQGK